MLNLGLSIPEQQVELVDVLSSELAFKEAYQEFVDYANVCEIVARARASEERMGFACELLGTSIENVHVSFESFSESINRAWEAFLNFWSNLFQRIRSLFSSKSKAKGPVTVHTKQKTLEWIPEDLAHIITEYPNVMSGGTFTNMSSRYAQRVASGLHDETMTLNSDEEIASWIQAAEKATAALNSFIVKVSKLKEEDMLVTKPAVTMSRKHYNTAKEVAEKNKDKLSELKASHERKRYRSLSREYALRRYVMMYFPKLIKKITKDVEALKQAK